MDHAKDYSFSVLDFQGEDLTFDRAVLLTEPFPRRTPLVVW